MTEKLKVCRPFDESIIQELDMDEWSAIDQKLEKAAALAKDRREMIPASRRMAILEACADLVEQRIDTYALQAAEEGGKPLKDSKVELIRAVNGIREAARSLNQLGGEEIPMQLNEASKNRMAYTLREPIGVVAAVSAFNHPFNLIVHQVIPAVAVGCPVLVKPAGTTPLSCINVLTCLKEAGLPDGWVQLVLCSTENAEKFVTDERVAFLTFIGSAKVGWMLRSKVHPGVRCALEHGGAAPVIVEPDADIKDMLPLLARGGMYHAGQVCVSVQRVYIHEDILKEAAAGLVEQVQKMTIGDPKKKETDIGPLISPKEVDRIEEWVQEAIDGGAELLTGGKRIGQTCFEATILLNPSNTARVSQEEIFGPVMCLYSYSDRDDAIERANSLPFSFQAAVFTHHLDVALDTMKRLEAMAVMINDHTAFRVDWMPFGGRKKSGLGVGGILPAMKEMTEEKLFVIKSPVL